MEPSLIWGSPGWLLPAAVLTFVALVVLGWAYRRARASARVRAGAALLKALGIAALVVCLIEPLFNGTRPRPGANLFVLLADDSQSLRIRDRGAGETRGEALGRILNQDSEWKSRLSQDFDVRRYSFDTQLRSVSDFAGLAANGTRSSLVTSLQTVARRYRDRPLAGILLFTDGNATDEPGENASWKDLPPVYSVLIGESAPERDVGVERVAVSQTGFEASPVNLRAEVSSRGFEGEEIVVQLLDTSGSELQRQKVKAPEDQTPLALSFQLRPEKSGVSFYRLRAGVASELDELDAPEKSREATLANNERFVVVDRGRGPYRVLYISGRPNWDFKFLRRALEKDPEVELVGLIRIAMREPKFEYRGRAGESTNPLFRGFGNQGDEEVESYDQAVMMRVGDLEDAEELRDGFPKAADQLYGYHAIILDDLEAGFFTRDQMSLIQKFVGQRGGGFLMLGGAESFDRGDYQRTPIEELLPVYLDRYQAAPAGRYRLSLTREGWLEPWVRLRSNEQEERQRLDAMPMFQTVNRIARTKPGATVLSRVTDTNGRSVPALVAQRFGRGRAAALMIGDLWRWGLRRETHEEQDLAKAWRQTVRWLVGDVPQRVEVDVARQPEAPGPAVEVKVRLRDEEYAPLDNATALVKITSPDGSDLELTAIPSDQEAGVYVSTYVPRPIGAYRFEVAATGADGGEVGSREAGWTEEGAAEEFRRLTPNGELLERIARETGGEVVPPGGIDAFVRGLPNRRIPITQAWIYPLWNQWWVFVLAIACLTGEWGLRRVRGLP